MFDSQIIGSSLNVDSEVGGFAASADFICTEEFYRFPGQGLGPELVGQRRRMNTVFEEESIVVREALLQQMGIIG